MGWVAAGGSGGLSFSLLAGPLSPVNHKGLHQGWKQMSVYLLQLCCTQVIKPQDSSKSTILISTQIQNIHIYTQKSNTTFRR